MKPLTREQAEAVYRVLIHMADANPLHFGNFVHTQMEGCREWRFIGCLGFGGKFYNSCGKWYVDMYGEDETDERLKVKLKVNRRLRELHREFNGESSDGVASIT